VAVDNIDAAMQLILDEAIQLVITDWVMPEGDGTELCRRVRQLNLPFYTYIILVTSLEGSQSLVDGMAAGADDFIHKPLKMDELLARVRASERVLRLERSLYERNIRLENLSNTLLAAQKIINADLKVAERIQRRLLPHHSSSLLGVAIDGLFCPSNHVSGDIYNFFLLDEHHIGFYSIDVAGHGVAAAMMSLTLSQLLIPEIKSGNPVKYSLPVSPYYKITMPVSCVVDALNQQFQTDDTGTLYFTMVYGVIDTRQQRVELCQAGHPNPIYMAHNQPAQFVGDGGFPVGITSDAYYDNTSVDYAQGDRLFFYSDGITECMNNDGEMFGEARLLAFIENNRAVSVRDMLATLEQELITWHGSAKFDDDISILTMMMLDNIT
jgi:sigma-B regulation protein RsbU (phosphoserine phosphatase)